MEYYLVKCKFKESLNFLLCDDELDELLRLVNPEVDSGLGTVVGVALFGLDVDDKAVLKKRVLMLRVNFEILCS